MRDMLRPAVFIPESKRLNVLLREFRTNRNHMAIVVDEYGGVAGLVTIEDVLEQIVGDIEDEYDFDETEDNILREKRRPLPRQGADRDRRFQRDLRHGVPRRGIRHHRRAGASTASAACPSAARRSTIDDLQLPGAARRQPPPAYAAGRAECKAPAAGMTRGGLRRADPPRGRVRPARRRGARRRRGRPGSATGPALPAPARSRSALLLIGSGCGRARRARPPGSASPSASGLFLVGVSWVYVSLHDFGGMPAPLAAFATLLFCLYPRAVPAAVGYVQARLRRRCRCG